MTESNENSSETPLFYGSISQVKIRSGVDQKDLGIIKPTDDTVDELFDNTITEMMLEIKSLIDKDREFDILKEYGNDISKIPKCLHMIGNRIAINVLKQAKINRMTPVIKIDEYTVQLINDNIMTNAIQEDLERCVKKRIDIASMFGAA